MHICSLIFQTLAFAIAFVVGVMLIVKANFLSSSKKVIYAIRDDDNYAEKSDLKVRDDEAEDALNTLSMIMNIIGAILLAIAIGVLLNIICLLALMCGPNSSFVKYGLCMEPLRDDLEDEIVDMKDEDELMDYYSRHMTSKLTDRTKRKMTEMKRRRERHLASSGGRGKHRGMSSPSASPGKDRRKYDKEVKSEIGHRRKQESNSASPKSDRHHYEKEIKKEVPPRRSTPSASPKSDRKDYDKKLRDKVGSDAFSSPSASPKDDRKKYDKEVKDKVGSDRFSSPSASPKNDRKKYDKKVEDKIESDTEHRPSASPEKDRKKYREDLESELSHRNKSVSSASAHPGKDRKKYEKDVESIVSSMGESDMKRHTPKAHPKKDAKHYEKELSDIVTSGPSTNGSLSGHGSKMLRGGGPHRYANSDPPILCQLPFSSSFDLHTSFQMPTVTEPILCQLRLTQFMPTYSSAPYITPTGAFFHIIPIFHIIFFI